MPVKTPTAIRTNLECLLAFFDIEADRRHPEKKNRPLASGKLPISVAWGSAILLAAAAIPVGYVISPALAGILALYLSVNLLYSSWLKHVRILDVFIVSSGFVLRVPGEPSLYLAGDTIWCGEVEAAIMGLRPQVIVVNSGAAQFLSGGPITMTAADVVRVCRAAPGATVVAVHLETLNHCMLSRLDLGAALDEAGVLSQVWIPANGETLTFP